VGNSYFIAQNLSLTSMSGGSSVSLFEFDLSEAITASAAQNDMTVPVAGVFSLYHAFNNTNPANTATWLLAKNNVASSLGVTFPNAAGGGTTNTWRTDAVNTLSVTAGDLIRQQCSLATTMRAFGCVFTPTGAHANPMGNGITSISGASTSGALSPTPNLSLTGILNTYAGTWRYLEARSRINTLNVAVNFFLAKNGSASGVTVTVGAGEHRERGRRRHSYRHLHEVRGHGHNERRVPLLVDTSHHRHDGQHRVGYRPYPCRQCNSPLLPHRRDPHCQHY
jgi:hypothetical protein